jgi:hypothetical protein
MHPESSPPIAILLFNVNKHCQDLGVVAPGGIELEVAQGKYTLVLHKIGSQMCFQTL